MGNGSALVFGGSGKGSDLCKDLAWTLSLAAPAEERWKQLPLDDSPPSRMGHTAIFDHVCVVDAVLLSCVFSSVVCGGRSQTACL
jgi:hypothetical protein